MMPSSLQAARLLNAWEHRDPRTFATELGQAAEFCRESADSLAELERRELLQGIVEEMKMMGAEGARRQNDEAGLYVELLTHLSRC
jgi:hypothetical protein